MELNSTILRVAYLLLTGVLLGYLAEQEKRSHAELAAIADATRQPRVNLGLGGSVAALARMLLTTFGSPTVVVVVDDHDGHRTLMWRVTARDLPDEPRVRRAELNSQAKSRWLFSDFGSAWQVTRESRGGGAVVAAVDPTQWRLRRFRAELSPEFCASQAFASVSVVNLGLAGEWQGRVYIFDPTRTDSAERTLHFLDALAEHVTPALTNVVLLRRLRARAGAAERARVARELHDGAIQSLFGIEMKLEAFRRAPDRSEAFVDAEVGAVQEQLRREVLALRELMQALRPIELEGGDQLPDVLAALVERFRRDTGISARFVANGGSVSIPPPQAVEIVRIVQEALANVRRHAGARNVMVTLTSGSDEYRLVIEDDGRGFDFEGRLCARELDQRRIGPAVIKERARIAGARLAIESTPGAGVRIELSFAAETEHA
jgi:signal transduction histidine kinase